MMWDMCYNMTVCPMWKILIDWEEDSVQCAAICTTVTRMKCSTIYKDNKDSLWNLKTK